MKKVASLVLALTMVLSVLIAVPVSAASRTINSLSNVKEPIVVSEGDRIFDVENGTTRELVGPESDIGTDQTPLIAIHTGSVVLKPNEIHIPNGSAVIVARSSTRPSNEKWTMEHETEIKYNKNVKVDVSITGPDLSTNPLQYCRVKFSTGSRNRKMNVVPLGAYYWVLNLDTNQPYWEKFNTLAVLDDSEKKPGDSMYQWSKVYKENAAQSEPEYTAKEGKVFKNQVYNASRKSHNDYNLYIPDSVKKGKPASLVICIHGGSWTGGAKEDMDYMCARFARHGYIAATVEYRLFKFNNDVEDPANSMDDMMADIRDCVNAVVKQTKGMGYNLVNMATTGYSAGGHLALLYGYAHPNDAAIPVKAVFSQVGPADFHASSWKPGLFQNQTLLNLYARVLIPGFEDLSESERQAALDKIAPTSYITKNTVPTVFTYGKEDHIVGYGHGAVMDEKLTACGVPHKFITLGKSDHPSEFDRAALDDFWNTTYQYGAQYLSPQQ